MPLPKIIHLIWIGDQSKKPQKFIETWIEQNPDYEIRIWGNKEINRRKWLLPALINTWFNREICGAVDILRWEILHQFGGLAFDADSICVRPLEDWLLDVDCFAAWENEIVRPGLIAVGAMGFTPEHPLLTQIIRGIARDPDPYNGQAWEKTGPCRLTETVKSHRFINLTIYPSHYFFPKHFSGLKYTGGGHVFAEQYWNSTRQNAGLEIIDEAGPAAGGSTPPV